MRAFALALALLTLATSASADVSVGGTGSAKDSAGIPPRGTFRVEQLFHPPPVGVVGDVFTIWLVSTRDPASRARLPEIPLTDVDRGATSGNIGYESDLSISPDERFIFRD